MANVLNPETESTTLNTELETPTLEPATEQEQPLPESTSNLETAEVVDISALDADAPTEPGVEDKPVAEATEETAPTAEVATEVPAQPAQPAMAPEVQTTMIEVNRVLTQEQVSKGELPPLPPTELTPPEEAAKITTPGPGNPGN